jgi:hypothetical protein
MIMANQPHDPNNNDMTPQQAANIMFWVMRIVGACFWSLIRCDQGIYWGTAITFPALILMILYAAVTESEAVFCYIVVWLCFCIYRRAKADPRQQSGFAGTNYITIRIPGFRTEKRSRMLEPFLLFFLGWVIYQFSQSLGVGFFAGGFATAWVTVAENAVMAVRLRKVHDARIEMETLSEEAMNR